MSEISSQMSERNSVLIGYGLFLLGIFTGGLTTLIGVIVAHIRLEKVRGTLYESHYRNMILVFWVWLAVVVVAATIILASIGGAALSQIASWPVFSLALIPAGITVWVMLLAVAGAYIWYYWRLVRGLIQALDDKPY